MTDTVELWSPITDEGMSMTPGELIDEFYKRRRSEHGHA